MIESIGLILVPYSELLANVASTLTCLQFLSALLFLNDIRKKNTTEGFSVIPILCGTVLSACSVKFGSIIRDDAIIKTNIFGVVLNLIILIFYYYFTPSENKLKLWGQIGLSGSIITGLCIYSDWEDPKLIEFRLGVILTIVLIVLVGSPLLSLGDIMKKQSTEGLPFPMIFSGTLVSASWMLYSLSTLNEMMVFQNAFLLFLGCIQLSLFVIYPSTNKSENMKKKE